MRSPTSRRLGVFASLQSNRSSSQQPGTGLASGGTLVRLRKATNGGPRQEHFPCPSLLLKMTAKPTLSTLAWLAADTVKGLGPRAMPSEQREVLRDLAASFETLALASLTLTCVQPHPLQCSSSAASSVFLKPVLLTWLSGSISVSRGEICSSASISATGAYRCCG